MSVQKNSSNIIETFIIEDPSVGLSGSCSAIYTNIIEPCIGQTELNLNADVLVSNSLSATTFYGDGSQLTGVHNYFTTGATFNNNTLYFDRNDVLSAYTVDLSYLDNTPALNAHTGDTSIHFQLSAITLSNIGDSAHTHSISGITNLQTELDNKAYLSGATFTGPVYGTSISANTVDAVFYGDGFNIGNLNPASIVGYVHISGETMTGDLIVPNLTVNSLSGSTNRVVKVDPTGMLIASDDKISVINITGLTVVDTFSNSICDATVWDYVIKSSTGIRAGTITGVWSGNTAEYYEISTNDIGNTQSVSLSVTVVAGVVRLNINVSTGNWSMKVNRTSL